MLNINRNLFLRPFVFIFIVLFLSLNSFSRIYHNHGDESYVADSGGSVESYIAGNPISNYIIEGAGYFLAGYADVLLLLNRFEMSDLKGIDYNEVKQISDKALNNLKNTGAIYDNLIAVAERTPYNEVFLEKLASFGYESFMENNSLNRDVFEEVEVFLNQGDITGTFKQSRNNFDLILGILNSIKESIDAEKMPPLSKLWQLNQVYAAELLFGQYSAQVYYAIK
jgi:hypothetical protein